MNGPVIVTGSRDWPDYKVIWRALAIHQPTMVIHGAARGADTMAENWARRNAIPYLGYPAKWDGPRGFDRGAGHARNAKMLDAHPGVLVLAFPHPEMLSAGTRGCMAMAKERGHCVRCYGLDGELVAS